MTPHRHPRRAVPYVSSVGKKTSAPFQKLVRSMSRCALKKWQTEGVKYRAAQMAERP